MSFCGSRPPGWKENDRDRPRRVGVRPELDSGDLPKVGHDRLGELPSAVLDGGPADPGLELEGLAEGPDGGSSRCPKLSKVFEMPMAPG